MLSLNILDIVLIHFTFVSTYLILAFLSKIFGSAKRMKPLYKLYYVATVLSILAALIELFLADRGLFALLPGLFDILALTLSSWVTYFYWVWVPKELAKEG